MSNKNEIQKKLDDLKPFLDQLKPQEGLPSNDFFEDLRKNVLSATTERPPTKRIKLHFQLAASIVLLIGLSIILWPSQDPAPILAQADIESYLYDHIDEFSESDLFEIVENIDFIQSEEIEIEDIDLSEYDTEIIEELIN